MIEIVSPLSTAEVTQRLLRLLDGMRDVSGQHSVLTGRVVESRIELMRTQRTGNSAFRPQFTGSVKPTAAGTVIVGSFGLATKTKSFMRRWFITIGIWLICTIVVASTDHTLDAWLLPSGGLVLLGIGAAFLHFAKAYHREDQQWLLKLLSDTLESKAESRAAPV
jgi:hypothetical protein